MSAALHLAWSLVRIRHLTLSLFIFPLIISVVLVLGQLMVTGMFLRSFGTGAADIESATKTESNPVRLILYGSGDERPPLRVCRWVPARGNSQGEIPPSEECRPDRLDVAVHVDDPTNASIQEYSDLFQGQIDRLHVCRACSPDVVIDADTAGKKNTHVGSAYGLAVLSLAFKMKGSVKEDRDEYIKMLSGDIGKVSLSLPESAQPIELSKTNGAIPFAANIVPMVIIALWLSLRAHRKVLDYFARNDVLLPLVAATGKKAFYGALWILTLFRVTCFLAAAIPIMYFGLRDISGDTVFQEIAKNTNAIVLWLAALVAAVSLATIISSIADLKHRQAFVNVLYRYLPMFLAMLGGCVWLATFIFPSETAGLIRLGLTAVPVLGLAPLFIAPITRPEVWVLLVHAVCSAALVVVILRGNARWFAAHLEEV
jgi:hypothetical protein